MKDMRKFILLVFATCPIFVANAQYYGNGTQKIGNSKYANKSENYQSEYTSDKSVSTSSWDGGVWGVKYTSTFEDAGKGSFGIVGYGFGKNPLVMSMMLDGIYNLGTEKFFEYYQFSIGPNLNLPMTDNVILFAPVCLSMSQVKGSEKFYWGATVIPSIGLKFGRLFLSAGWNLFYDFSAKEDQFNSKQFAISLAIFTKN